MSEEIEVPLEKIQEDLHHLAHEVGNKLMTYCALLSALLAVLAAVCALHAGALSNDAMMEQIRAADSWGYYQAKSLKSSLLEVKIEIMHERADEFKAKQDKYQDELTEIKAKAEELEKESREHLARHETMARAVTFFQVAIALTAIAALTRRRNFIFVSGAMGAAGVYFMVMGFL
jgi:chromosome segregation ATPase